MRITNKRSHIHATYSISNHPLEWCESMKYLGVTINSKLKWSDQVNGAALKATRLLHLLKRSMYGCSKVAKARAYKAIVRPHLEYCAPVWTPHTKKDLNHLENVQRRAVRWISSTTWDRGNHRWARSYDEDRNALNLMLVASRHNFLSCCQMYKIVNSLDCLASSGHLQHPSGTVSTRSHHLSLQVIQSRVNAFRFSFFVNSPFVWNNLPSSIIGSQSYHSFKSQLRLYLP